MPLGDKNTRIVVDTDTSNNSIDAVLPERLADVADKSYAYASRVFILVRSNTACPKRELMAVVYVLRWFRQDVLRQLNFQVCTNSSWVE